MFVETVLIIGCTFCGREVIYFNSRAHGGRLNVEVGDFSVYGFSAVDRCCSERG